MKNELRKKYKLIRENIKYREEKSNIISNKIINLEEYQNSNVIAVFKSFSSEVDTSTLIKDALSMQKEVVLPRTYKNEIKFYKIKSINDDFEKNEFGIEEPKENIDNYVEKEKIDLIIVPGLCFDKEKNRLGYGGGYYDRFLSNNNAKKIGICFEDQIYSELIPVNKNDIKMDIVITEKEEF